MSAPRFKPARRTNGTPESRKSAAMMPGPSLNSRTSARGAVTQASMEPLQLGANDPFKTCRILKCAIQVKRQPADLGVDRFTISLDLRGTDVPAGSQDVVVFLDLSSCDRPAEARNVGVLNALRLG